MIVKMIVRQFVMRSACVAALALAAACGDDSGPQETEGQPPAAPMTTTVADTTGPATTTGVVATTGDVVEGCCTLESEERVCSACPDASEVCATRRVTGQTPTAADFACQAECVGESAAAYWCGDDSSCCNAEATCDLLTGVCVVPMTTTTSGDTDTDAGTDTDADTDGTTAAGG